MAAGARTVGGARGGRAKAPGVALARTPIRHSDAEGTGRAAGKLRRDRASVCGLAQIRGSVRRDAAKAGGPDAVQGGDRERGVFLSLAEPAARRPALVCGGGVQRLRPPPPRPRPIPPRSRPRNTSTSTV